MSLIIVSNRLPFSINTTGKVTTSSGGLVTAISGIKNNLTKKWVGIAPDKVTQKKWKKLEIENKKNYKPVFIDNTLYKKYYNGISNEVIWPIFHYEISHGFKWSNWDAYEQVNKIIAERVQEISKPEDLIWIHDFHLFLVPKFLRKMGNKNKIGFFLHIPFPSSELFRQIPARKEILDGVLNSDLIGFQEYSYLKHFCNSAKIILGLNSNMLNINYNNNEINLGVFPVSIDTNTFVQKSKTIQVQEIYNKLQKNKNYTHLILGIDRLDYIKGFLIKLESFRELLKQNPEFIGKVSLLQIAVPSREDVPKYSELKKNVERLISEINGEFSHPNYTPIQYIYSSVSFEEMVALYKNADILFVTSRRDGMNLVAFEYLVSQDKEKPGVLVLSEFTGAASILSHSLLINPWDIKNTAEKLATALKMSNEEKKQRYQEMFTYLNSYTATDWANLFIKDLITTKKMDFKNKLLFYNENKIPLTANNKNKLILFIDYDGTIVPLEKVPEKAILNQDAFLRLNELLSNIHLDVVVVSGRDSTFLEAQFKNLERVQIAAEHGAKFFDKHNKKWINLSVSSKEIWINIGKKIIGDYTKRVPESFIEIKEFSIAWHYRLSPEIFSEYQAKKMKEELEIALSNLPVTIIQGNKVLEVRSIEANKGYFINWYLNKFSDISKLLIIAIGDDTTDEDMFNAIKNVGISIKVGLENSSASYILTSQQEVYLFLKILSNFKKGE